MASKEPSKFQRKLDALSRAVFLTDDGKPRSADLLYGFCLSLLFCIIYGASYLLLIGPIEQFFGGSAVPEAGGAGRLAQIAEYLIPALVGSVPCLALFLIRKMKHNLLPMAYVWMAVLLVGSALAMIGICADGEEYALFWLIVGIPFALSTLIGGAGAVLLYARERRAEQ